MWKGVFTIASLTLLTSACGGQSKSLRNQNQALNDELSEMRAAARRDRQRLKDLERQMALKVAAARRDALEEQKPNDTRSVAQTERPDLPIEVREAAPLESEYDLPDDYEIVGLDSEGVEIVYVGEAAKNDVLRVPVGRYDLSGGDDRADDPYDDDGYDDVPMDRPHRDNRRPALGSAPRPAASREIEPVPAVSENLGVTKSVPTIDAQMRQARQPAAPRTRTRSFGDPRAEYRRYYEALRAGNHSFAVTGFRNFVERFPTHDFADNAQYWLGEAFYDQKRYKSAMLEFRKVVDNHPQGNKVPDALLKLAYCYHAQGEKDKAIEVLRQVRRLYPKSNPASLAKTKLSELEGQSE